ncbi:MAG: protoglobin domain-containing protein [Flavobacteriaceae bacterium]
MSITTLPEITNRILSQIPDSIKLSDKDIEILHASKDFVLDREDVIFEKFFEILLNFEPTKNVFKEGEIPIVTNVFKRWLKITLSSEFNDKYWQWQTFVGLVHIKRGITNNVFISMLSVITEMLVEEVVTNVDKENAIPILKAWLRLSRMLSSLISESYRIFYLKTVEDVTNINEKLLDKMSHLAIDKLLKENQDFRL